MADWLVATALAVAGLALPSALGAPRWLMAVFLLPFLIYAMCRGVVSSRFALWFAGLFSVVSLTFTLFLPREYWHYSGGFVVVLLAPWAGKLRQTGASDQA